MPVWICSKCGYKVEGRCRPKKCPACGAPKEAFDKEA
jgi:rubrerythrin